VSDGFEIPGAAESVGVMLADGKDSERGYSQYSEKACASYARSAHRRALLQWRCQQAADDSSNWIPFDQFGDGNNFALYTISGVLTNSPIRKPTTITLMFPGHRVLAWSFHPRGVFSATSKCSI
jgi:hypothetical protein